MLTLHTYGPLLLDLSKFVKYLSKITMKLLFM